MKKHTLGIIIAIVALLSIGGIIYANRPGSDVSNNEASENSTRQETPTDTSKEYTKDEVALHNNEDDCWTVIGTNVYDITDYIPRHPGGSEILRACGTDGTTLFNSRKTPDGQEIGSGTPHSSSAKAMLNSMQVGVLAQ